MESCDEGTRCFEIAEVLKDFKQVCLCLVQPQCIRTVIAMDLHTIDCKLTDQD